MRYAAVSSGAVNRPHRVNTCIGRNSSNCVCVCVHLGVKPNGVDCRFPRSRNEAREIRTPNLLIWSQTRCHCAIAPCYLLNVTIIATLCITCGERKHGRGHKSTIMISKNWKDAKSQAKSGYLRTGRKSEKHRLAENRGKRPGGEPQNGV